MNVNSVSSQYLGNAMLPAIQQAQTQLSNLEVESSTGQYANLGLQLGNQSGYELSLRNDDDLLQALTSANGVTSTDLATAQTALSSLLSSAQTAASGVTSWLSDGNSSVGLQTVGESNLQQLIALANTTSSGQYVFGGQNTSTAPLDDYYASPTSTARTAVDNAFQSYFGFAVGSPQAANISASQMQSFLSGPFANLFTSPAWGSHWSNASDDDTTSEIAPGQSAITSTNANTLGFHQLAQGYAMLSEFGNIGLGAAAEQTLAKTSLGLITQGVSSVISTQAEIGASQTAITQANDYLSTQMAEVQTEIGKLDDVDAASVATQLSTLSTQLQTAYQLTAQIQRLSLAQYLPT
jgi:flagellar hook-associated protein 3 FlgL